MPSQFGLEYLCRVGLRNKQFIKYTFVENGFLVKYEYEGWNFNSGNYLFTTDTK